MVKIAKGVTWKVESRLTSKPLKRQSRIAFYLKSWIVDPLETSKLSKSQGALPETLNPNKVGASNIKGKHMELNFDHPELQILKTHKWFPAPRGTWQAPKISPRGLRNASGGKKTLTVSYVFPGFPGPPGSVLRRFTEGQRWLEKVREG